MVGDGSFQNDYWFSMLCLLQEYQTENAIGEGKSGDEEMDNDDDAYVHEAFLADWRPGILVSLLLYFLSSILQRKINIVIHPHKRVLMSGNGRVFTGLENIDLKMYMIMRLLQIASRIYICSLIFRMLEIQYLVLRSQLTQFLI